MRTYRIEFMDGEKREYIAEQDSLIQNALVLSKKKEISALVPTSEESKKIVITAVIPLNNIREMTYEEIDG